MLIIINISLRLQFLYNLKPIIIQYLGNKKCVNTYGKKERKNTN